MAYEIAGWCFGVLVFAAGMGCVVLGQREEERELRFCWGLASLCATTVGLGILVALATRSAAEGFVGAATSVPFGIATLYGCLRRPPAE